MRTAFERTTRDEVYPFTAEKTHQQPNGHALLLLRADHCRQRWRVARRVRRDTGGDPRAFARINSRAPTNKPPNFEPPLP
jgi:hypothetical protein